MALETITANKIMWSEPEDFSGSRLLPLSLSYTRIQTYTHSISHSFTKSLIYSLSHTLPLCLSLSFTHTHTLWLGSVLWEQSRRGQLFKISVTHYRALLYTWHIQNQFGPYPRQGHLRGARIKNIEKMDGRNKDFKSGNVSFFLSFSLSFSRLLTN